MTITISDRAVCVPRCILIGRLESALVFDPTPDSTVTERSSISRWRLSAEEYQQA